MWCIAKIDKEYRERTYQILKLYFEEYDPKDPVICFDDKQKYFIQDLKTKIPMKPTSPEKYDYTYKITGSANIFVAVNFKSGVKDITVTDRRTKKDFALYIKHLFDNVFTKAKKLKIIMDNLNTYKYISILENFDFYEAVNLISKLSFIYTPKHASWLNIAEIEINIMDTICTGGKNK